MLVNNVSYPRLSKIFIDIRIALRIDDTTMIDLDGPSDHEDDCPDSLCDDVRFVLCSERLERESVLRQNCLELLEIMRWPHTVMSDSK